VCSPSSSVVLKCGCGSEVYLIHTISTSIRPVEKTWFPSFYPRATIREREREREERERREVLIFKISSESSRDTLYQINLLKRSGTSVCEDIYKIQVENGNR